MTGMTAISHKDFARLANRVAQLERELKKVTGGEVYLTEETAQLHAGLKKDTLYRKFKRGVIPQGEIWRYAPDGRVIFDTKKLREWLRSAAQV